MHQRLLSHLTWASGKIAHRLFLDVAAAFERVWQKGLAAKLEQHGITKSFLTLLNFYIVIQKQIVVVDGVKSHAELTKYNIGLLN